MTQRTAERTFLAIPCPKCGHAFQESIARLVPKNGVACPKCGGLIDLQSGNNAAFLIQKLADECNTLDRTLAAADKKL